MEYRVPETSITHWFKKWKEWILPY